MAGSLVSNIISAAANLRDGIEVNKPAVRSIQPTVDVETASKGEGIIRRFLGKLASRCRSDILIRNESGTAKCLVSMHQSSMLRAMTNENSGVFVPYGITWGLDNPMILRIGLKINERWF
jgi:hypothetical protein